MQHLGAKVCQLRRFVEADHFNAPRLRTNARIGGKNPVHVGPDFNSLRAQTRAHESSGKIRTASSDRGGYASATRSDESPYNRNLPGVEQRLYFGLQPCVSFFFLRNSLHVIAVGHQYFTRVDKLAV